MKKVQIDEEDELVFNPKVCTLKPLPIVFIFVLYVDPIPIHENPKVDTLTDLN